MASAQNMGRYGLALKYSDFWFLTDPGVEFVSIWMLYIII